MSLRRAVTALAAGLLFGSGLLVSGMTDPANIFAFLDVTGAWSPAMPVVMASAIAVAAPVFAWVRRRGNSLFQSGGAPDNRRPVDRRLLIGSAVFGAGWGLSGICPGPGLMLAAQGAPFALAFVAAMTAGMLAANRLDGGRDD